MLTSYGKTSNHACLLHRSLQYFTSSHTFSHFLRQVKGRPQTGHTFFGKWALEGLLPERVARAFFDMSCFYAFIFCFYRFGFRHLPQLISGMAVG